MVNKIKDNLDKYLGFDSSIIFFDEYIRVFGGAVRDSISGDKINDIDILCGAQSLKGLEKILFDNGYTHMKSVLTSVEIAQIYSIKHVINEPHTWIKGDKIVQLIRPVPNNTTGFLNDSQLNFKKSFSDLIANVDISCCGVSYNNGVLYENYPNAVVHCSEKIFKVNQRAKMYIEQRISHRRAKLLERGWDELSNSKVENRELKLVSLLNPLDFEYVKEYLKPSFEISMDMEDLPF